LKTLNLYRNYLKDDGAKVLAEENELEKIEEMDLAQNEIGDEGYIALSISSRFPNLVALYLDNNFGTREGRESARQGPTFKKLQSLNL
jgi:Ran GTPase-activating protein (RanGAP) involved in mRNA processing and transport